MPEARYPFTFDDPAPPEPAACPITQASDTEIGFKAIAEFDAIKAELARGFLTPDEKRALRERLAAALEMWERAAREPDRPRSHRRD